MSPDDQSHTPTDPDAHRSLWSRIPRHLLGGRVRTTTAVMVLPAGILSLTLLAGANLTVGSSSLSLSEIGLCTPT